jgi:hypothetical protein
MATMDTIPVPATTTTGSSPARPSWLRSNWGLLLAVVALMWGIFLPTPAEWITGQSC